MARVMIAYRPTHTSAKHPRSFHWLHVPRIPTVRFKMAGLLLLPVSCIKDSDSWVPNSDTESFVSDCAHISARWFYMFYC